MLNVCLGFWIRGHWNRNSKRSLGTQNGTVAPGTPSETSLAKRMVQKYVPVAGAALTGAVISATIVVMVDELSFLGINLLVAAWGAVAFPLYAISVAHANDYAETSEYVMVSSGLLLMYGIGAILGPFAASAVMTMTSAVGLYLFIGTVQLLLVVYVMMITASRSPLWVCQSPHHHYRHYRAPLLRDAGERVGSSDRVLHPRVDGAPERNRHQVVLRGGPEGTGSWEAWIGPLF